MIMAMKLTALAVEKTEERFAFSSRAMGADRLLQAYMEPMHRLIRQLAARISQRFLVSRAVCPAVSADIVLLLIIAFDVEYTISARPGQPDVFTLRPSVQDICPNLVTSVFSAAHPSPFRSPVRSFPGDKANSMSKVTLL